jgi:HEPN domain-containing protein
MANEWLKSAKSDLLVIEKIIDEVNLSHIVAFHSQQAVEKSFKALLENRKIEFKKQHDLIKLKNKIDNFNIDEDMLDILNKLYIDSRYPGEIGLLPYGKPTIKDANEFFDFANIIYDKIGNILKEEE